MYNSVIVKGLVRSWYFLADGYQYSFLKKINDFMKRGLIVLFNGSFIMKIFTSDRSLIQESFLYGLYSMIINGVNKIFSFLRKGIDKVKYESIIHGSFSDKIQTQTTFYVFFITLGIGIVVNNITRGFYSGKSYIVSLFLILISFIGLSLKDDYKKVLEESYVYTFIKDFFTIDEGVKQWW